MSSTSQSGSRSSLENWRLLTVLITFGLIFFLFFIRLFYLQVLEHSNWLRQADDNRTEVISLAPQRGVIFDRNGVLLASNTASYNIIAVPAFLPGDSGEIEQIIFELAELTGLPVTRGSLDEPLIPCGTNLGLREMIAIQTSFSPYDPVQLQCNVSREMAMAIKEKSVDWPGVDIQVEPVRDYPTGEMTAAVIGYLGPIPAAIEPQMRSLGFVPNRDKVGYGGLELYFDEVLRGMPGQRVVETDVGGQVLRDIDPPIEAQPGQNIVLTLDMRLQQAAYQILKRDIELWNNFIGAIEMTSGSVIAMDPRTGEILAMVSWPSYENNRMARFIPAYYYDQLLADATNPLVNHAVGAEIPVGSVFKLVTSVGVLNEGVVSVDQLIQTPGLITVSEQFFEGEAGRSREFVDWNRAGFGQLNFIGGIANSSNVYFYKVGGGFQEEVPEGLGICRLGTYARALGYGDFLGIEQPYETRGLIPDPTWKRRSQGENWSTGDTYITSVGQGYVLASPLQILMSAVTIANDGVMMKPTLLREIVDGNGNVIQSFQPTIIRDLTRDAVIEKYENPSGIGACRPTGEKVTVEPWVIEAVQQGMRGAVQFGTLQQEFDNNPIGVAVAGKTGTAEYCDETAFSQGRCQYGNWPSHAWTLAYAPYDDPEIAVIAFVYNGKEGSSVGGPIVRQLLSAYFGIKEVDNQLTSP